MATQTLTPKQVFSDLEKKKIQPVYVLFGDEPFKSQEFLQKFSEILGLDFSKIEKADATKISTEELIESLSTRSLFAPVREQIQVLVLQEAGAFKENEKLHRFLEEKISSNEAPDSVLVLLFESLDGRKKFHQWLKKNTTCLEFKKAKDAELMGWVTYLAKKHGLRLSAEAAQFLGVCCENSLYQLSSEIEKLSAFLGEKASSVEVDLQTVTRVCSNHATPEMIELVRAILERKRFRALILSEKLVASSEEALSLVGFLNWSLKNPLGKVRPIGGFDFWIPKLLKLDESLKTTGIEPRILVDRFVVETSQV